MIILSNETHFIILSQEQKSGKNWAFSVRYIDGDIIAVSGFEYKFIEDAVVQAVSKIKEVNTTSWKSIQKL